MANVIFRPQAYCKIILHAAKYPHCSINGLLLANRKGKHDAQTDLYIEDAIPLFHICLHVSPMTEVALTMVDQMASEQGLEIVGYYMANENVTDVSSDKPAHRSVSDKIVENFSGAVLAVIDNKEMNLGMYTNPLRVLQHSEGKWKTKDKSCVKVSNEKAVNNTIYLLLKSEEYKNIVDFDNHFDDIELDWKNVNIEEAVSTLMSQDKVK